MSQAECEILRESFGISSYGLIQCLNCHAINPRQIRIKNHALATNLMDEW